MKIRVNQEKMMDFADYVSAFPDRICTECSEISSAAYRLGRAAGDEDISEILHITQKMVMIVSESDADLAEISESIARFVDHVERVNAVSNV